MHSYQFWYSAGMSGKRNWGDNMTDRQDGKSPPPVVEVAPTAPSKLWKKKYKCKKNKGDHTLQVRDIYYSGWHQEKNGTWINPASHRWGFHSYWVTWECTACKKRVLEWHPPQKKFDRFRHTIWVVV